MSWFGAFPMTEAAARLMHSAFPEKSTHGALASSDHRDAKYLLACASVLSKYTSDHPTNFSVLFPTLESLEIEVLQKIHYRPDLMLFEEH
jgi:hypothetical protein